jgi:hypothetical protein
MPASFEEFDEAAWDHCDGLFEAWKTGLYDKDFYYEVARKVVKHSGGGDAVELCAPQRGGFNVYYRVRTARGSGALIRFPQPAYFRDAEEKILAEVATMRYISKNTTIPIPLVFHHGSREESPGGLGPFIILGWVENNGDLVDVMNTPGLTLEDTPLFNMNIDEAKLEHLYLQVADILLQLSQCEFPAIGSLGLSNASQADKPEVQTRPLSINISQLANFARVPHFTLPSPSKTFSTASEYYSALADMHLQQLSFQRNQAVDSADDCRKKYIAR